MIGAKSTNGDTACYSQITLLDTIRTNVLVENNLCQGSDGTGFNLPHTPCGLLGGTNNAFINNVAGSSKVGFVLSGNIATCSGG